MDVYSSSDLKHVFMATQYQCMFPAGLYHARSAHAQKSTAYVAPRMRRSMVDGSRQQQSVGMMADDKVIEPEA
jgi:hypothetical protein